MSGALGGVVLLLIGIGFSVLIVSPASRQWVIDRLNALGGLSSTQIQPTQPTSSGPLQSGGPYQTAMIPSGPILSPGALGSAWAGYTA